MYSIFNFQIYIKTDLTRKYHERRLRRFFDYIEFETNKKLLKTDVQIWILNFLIFNQIEKLGI